MSNDINAREVFFVDNDGNLNYDSTLILEKDKLNIENTKQEMINYKKVTKTKDKKNISNESIYDNNYFEGDNNDWQYIQFGGLNSHIDISNQVGADKVEHSNNLNETLGLY
ncbi:hypothetical protein [Spiroplasma endosymbiont of Colias croceus]|uniref:hypothetical protein n=1 Tax=Spiroplasma endosymbiont of Colias croceus TaxID=3066310 RepID=UPI0030D0A99F